MTETYTTETGYYVLVDSEGRIGAKADVSKGTHPVPEWADPTEMHDVNGEEELKTISTDFDPPVS